MQKERVVKLKKVSFFLGGLLLICGLILFVIGLLNPAGAGVRIETTPSATVYINGEQVGQTPFTDSFEPGEIVIRLVPTVVGQALSTYETKLNLVEGIETALLYEFGTVPEAAAGTVVSFEKINSVQSFLSVVSQPDAAQVTLDGSIVGFTPFKVLDTSVGQHLVEVLHPGFGGRSVAIQTRKGYNLTVAFILAKTEANLENQNLEAVVEKEIVTILTTPTGFLRVRAEASLASIEVGQVEPGEEFEILETDATGKWYKIEYAKSKFGWIAAEYAQKNESLR